LRLEASPPYLVVFLQLGVFSPGQRAFSLRRPFSAWVPAVFLPSSLKQARAYSPLSLSWATIFYAWQQVLLF
jgi:hypothetical protein